VGKIVSTAFLGITTATDITMTSLTAVMDVSVDLTVSTCVPTYERRWYTAWCWRHDTGASHWESENKNTTFRLNAGSIDLTRLDRGGVGIMVNDTTGIEKTIRALAMQIPLRVANIGRTIQQEGQKANPNATVNPMGQ